MLLAIDVGNTQTTFGVYDGSWKFVWRRATRQDETADEIAAWLRSMFQLEGIPFELSRAIGASVVPPAKDKFSSMTQRWLGTEISWLEGSDFGIEILYEPESAVGADRLANAVGALAKFQPPLIVVDFGTATTFDAVDAQGRYAGGAILPGVVVSAEALISRAAKLGKFELKPPDHAIGRSTTESLRSGVILGYAGAIDTLAGRIAGELGGNPPVIATGGLSGLFIGICKSLVSHQPNLTLEGLRLAAATGDGNPQG